MSFPASHPIAFFTLTLVAAGLFANVPSSAAGQEAEPPLVEGASVRILTAGSTTPVEGRLVEFDEAGLVYRASDGREVRLTVTDVESLERARLKRRTGEGILIGSLGGGLFLGMIFASGHDGDDWLFDQRDLFFIGGGLGALGGGLVGAVIGHNMISESWEPVVRPWGGLGLGVRLRF